MNGSHTAHKRLSYLRKQITWNVAYQFISVWLVAAVTFPPSTQSRYFFFSSRSHFYWGSAATHSVLAMHDIRFCHYLISWSRSVSANIPVYSYESRFSSFCLSAGMTVFSLSVEDDPSAQTDSTFPAFLSCKGCGQLLGDTPLGAGLDLGRSVLPELMNGGKLSWSCVWCETRIK